MATIQNINIGASANDNTGDPLRTAFDKTNQNNTALNNDLAAKQVALDLKAPLASPTFTGTVITVNDAYINEVRVGRGSGNIATNTALGVSALLSNTSGNQNIAAGLDSMRLNTTGIGNSAFGKDSLRNSNGNGNTAIGYSALFSHLIGDGNTALGAGALINNKASQNTAIGNNAGSNNDIYSNTTSLGYNSQITASNQITLGDSSINSLRCNVQVITSLSDKRDKTEIKEISEGLDFVYKLKPVTFTWNQRDGGRVGIKSAGFIAQDLLELQNDSLIGENLDLVSNDNPEQLEARYANLMPIMIKAIQELKAEIELLKSK